MVAAEGRREEKREGERTRERERTREGERTRFEGYTSLKHRGQRTLGAAKGEKTSLAPPRGAIAPPPLGSIDLDSGIEIHGENIRSG